MCHMNLSTVQTASSKYETASKKDERGTTWDKSGEDGTDKLLMNRKFHESCHKPYYWCQTRCHKHMRHSGVRVISKPGLSLVFIGLFSY